MTEKLPWHLAYETLVGTIDNLAATAEDEDIPELERVEARVQFHMALIATSKLSKVATELQDSDA